MEGLAVQQGEGRQLWGSLGHILTETWMTKMQEELEIWMDKDNDSPLVARHDSAGAELGS